MIYWILHILLWLPVHIFFPTKIVGNKKLLKKGAVVLACNHYTNFDVLVLNVYIRRFRYLAKKELMKSKLSCWFLKKMGAFPVDRGNADISSVRFSLGVLKSGKALGVFPEGTRNKQNEGEMQALKSGAILFSIKGGAPLYPAVFVRKTKFFRRNWLIIGEKLEFAFENNLKPSKEELEKATDILSSTMQKLQDDFWIDKNKKKLK